jgi:hypothetical protein
MMWEHNDNGSLHRCLHYIGNSHKMQNRHLNVLQWLRTNRKPPFPMSTVQNKKKPGNTDFSAWCTEPRSFHLHSYPPRPCLLPHPIQKEDPGDAPLLHFHGCCIVAVFYHALHKRSTPTSSRLRLQRLHGRRIVASFHLGLKTNECIIKQFWNKELN